MEEQTTAADVMEDIISGVPVAKEVAEAFGEAVEDTISDVDGEGVDESQEKAGEGMEEKSDGEGVEEDVWEDDDDDAPIIVNDMTPLPQPIYEWMLAHDLSTTLERNLGEQLGLLRKISDNSQKIYGAKAKIFEAFKAAYQTKEQALAKKEDWIRAFEVLCNKGTDIALLRQAKREKIAYTHFVKKLTKEEEVAMSKEAVDAHNRKVDLHNMHKKINMRKTRLFTECMEAAFGKNWKKRGRVDEELEDPHTIKFDRLFAALMKLCRSDDYDDVLYNYVCRELDKIKEIRPRSGPKQTKIPQRKVPKLAAKKTPTLGASRKQT